MTKEKEKLNVFEAAEATRDAAEAAYNVYVASCDAATATQNETAKEKFETGKDIYVTVFENPNDKDGSIIFETYLKHSSKENMVNCCKRWGEKYGKYKIAKVTIVDNN